MPELKRDEAAWFSRAVNPADTKVTVSFALSEILAGLGVQHGFGIVGGGIAPFAEALDLSDIDVWHTRHEAGAAFSATEASLVTDHPTVVFVTTGPGLVNALNGILAARWDGATVILISGSTNAEHRGRFAVQETSSYTMPTGALFSAGHLFDFAVQLGSVSELHQVARRLQLGVARPQGFVAHISLPLSIQTALVSGDWDAPRTEIHTLGSESTGLDHAASLLRGSPFAIWAGFGARHAAEKLRVLAERTGAAVMCTPRAKGVFPENHPLYVGVTGAGGHPSVEAYMRTIRPDFVLVLGTRMGEASSFWSEALVPAKGFIHVDIDTSVTGVAFPKTANIAVQAEIGAFVDGMLRRLPPSRSEAAGFDIVPLEMPETLSPRHRGPVRPQYLMQVLQRRVVERSQAVVMSESGNAFSWANHHLRFCAPGRYRTSAQYGSMGHVVTGVVGTALSLDEKVVAIVGDGAMLMNNEISTAVSYNAKAVWVVLNDARYGITQQAMQAQGYRPVATEIPSTDFVAYARSMGADGVRVSTELALFDAMEVAMGSDRPFVVDVRIDRAEISPVLKKRIDSLKRQGATVSVDAQPKTVPTDEF